ncbi:TetR/AcrR family transcriptional regulator [Streptomyces sp. AJS327]|uniref:TetR/AcrR family transcriptional regulator n=1 Tax=Streptomyces sp. AJS327 TaxID=2545265 RepID=UPI0015DF3004|nr:TetR family transcriptional regulator [Streptomyces sp. AJS327]MBA0053841.1 TetR/AcrR family transcriptional regulator [Streptomyces sp. AJS327]
MTSSGSPKGTGAQPVEPASGTGDTRRDADTGAHPSASVGAPASGADSTSAGDLAVSSGAAGGGQAAEAAPRRRGRGRPARGSADDGPGTRERILASARSEFAERGYDRASIRGIARGAGVDPALVHHYFGNKEQVFAAAVVGGMTPVFVLPNVISDGPREQLGERIARTMFDIWEAPETREPLVAILRSALNNDTAATIFRQMVTRNLLTRVAHELGLVNRELRVELAVAQLVGAALLRYVIKLEPLASEPVEVVVERLAPIVDRHLTGEWDSPP